MLLMTRKFMRAAVYFLSLWLANAASFEPLLTPSPLVKVMSFNIRYGTADDGTNSWQYRAHLVVEAIRAHDPDLIGMQEVLNFQAQWLQEQLPEYGFHGVGREDGEQKGEMVPVFYRKARFVVTNRGHFWLSETPDIAGSRSWDSALPRMVSWLILHDLLTGHRFCFMNTHFDHRGALARSASAKLLRTKAKEIACGLPIVITGDFNSHETDEPYEILVRGKGLPEGTEEWVDAYRRVHPVPTGLETTFNGWSPVRKGMRIDWIIHTQDFVPLDARIVYYQERGRLPSDHYPVWAVLRFR